MELIALIILILFGLIGLGAVFVTTFGTLLILIGAFLYALLTGFSILDIKLVFILLILYLCGEVVEYISVIAGAKKLGASNLAVFGALLGGIIGAVLGVGVLGVGLIIGTFLGIFLGAFAVELLVQRNLIKSLKAGAGSVIGRTISIVAKVIIAVIMLIIIVLQLLQHYIF